MTYSTNALDLLYGVKVQMAAGDWVSNYGSYTGVDLGFLRGVEMDPSRVTKNISADNALMPIGGYYTGMAIKLKAEILQESWLRFARFFGDADSTVVSVAYSKGATDGTITYLGDEPGAPRYMRVVLTAPNTSVMPAVAPGTTDVYTSLVYTFPKCICAVKGPLAFAKDKESTYKIEIEVYEDTSVTSGSGQIFKWVGTMPK